VTRSPHYAARPARRGGAGHKPLVTYWEAAVADRPLAYTKSRVHDTIISWIPDKAKDMHREVLSNAYTEK